MKKVNGHQIIELFEKWSPKHFAMDGDPVGLHIGQLNRPVENVLVTLDVNEAVIDEAIEVGANLIIAHHPPIFRPLKNILTDTPQGRVFEKCIKNDIAVYAAHTNLDVAPGGVNDMLAERLGLKETRILSTTYHESFYKLIVFCPVADADNLRDSLDKAGAGSLGDYSGCSFTSTGTGRFTPSAAANPHIGQAHVKEEVAEEKIEVIMAESIKNKVLKAMLSAHPYEEPAYDVLLIDGKTNQFGLGRIGKLAQPMTLKEFAENVKSVFHVPQVRFVGSPHKEIKKVAVLGGDGNKYIYDAKRNGADVLVTGDLYYHVAHDAEAMGLSVVDPGHNIEKIMIEGVANYMSKETEALGFDVKFTESAVITEPFQFL